MGSSVRPFWDGGGDRTWTLQGDNTTRIFINNATLQPWEPRHRGLCTQRTHLKGASPAGHPGISAHLPLPSLQLEMKTRPSPGIQHGGFETHLRLRRKDLASRSYPWECSDPTCVWAVSIMVSVLQGQKTHGALLALHWGSRPLPRLGPATV